MQHVTCQIERRRPLLPRQLYSPDCCSRISANFEKRGRNWGITVNRVHTALCRDPHHLTVIPPPLVCVSSDLHCFPFLCSINSSTFNITHLGGGGGSGEAVDAHKAFMAFHRDWHL